MKKENISEEQKIECSKLQKIWLSKKKEKKLTQDDIANMLGVTQGAITQFLNGHTAINLTILLGFAKILGFDPYDVSPRLCNGFDFSSIYSSEDNEEIKNVKEAQAHYKYNNKIPLISWDKIHIPQTHRDKKDIKEWITPSKNYPKSTFALSINHDLSNNEGIKKGTIIIVDPEVQAKNNDIVLITFDNDNEATLRKYINAPPHKYLESLNPKYDPIKLTSLCKIHGVITETINRLT